MTTVAMAIFKVRPNRECSYYLISTWKSRLTKCDWEPVQFVIKNVNSKHSTQ